jgi:hypothetical protein
LLVGGTLLSVFTGVVVSVGVVEVSVGVVDGSVVEVVDGPVEAF